MLPHQSSIDDFMVRRPLSALSSESVTEPSAVLRFFEACSSDPRLHHLLGGVDGSILAGVFGLLAEPAVSSNVVKTVLTVADNLLDGLSAPAGGSEVVVAEAVVKPHIPRLLEAVCT